MKSHFIKFSLLFSICIVVLELFSRIYIGYYHSVPFYKLNHIQYRYYYPLIGFTDKTPLAKDSISVLLLGASVLEDSRGNIREKLESNLNSNGHQKFKVYNLAQPATGSPDAYYKLKLLDNYHFDYVFFYHGINETRLNYIEEKDFTSDYGYNRWYNQINRYMAHPELSYFALPYFLDHLLGQLFQKPKEEKEFYALRDKIGSWEHKKVLSADAFGKNLQSIVGLCTTLKSKLIVGTYSYYIPQNYDSTFIKDFYSYHRDMKPLPIELWGNPIFVKRVIDAHNAKLSSIAFENQNSEYISLLDLNALMVKNKENYNDICHLTNEGALQFSDILSRHILRLQQPYESAKNQ